MKSKFTKLLSLFIVAVMLFSLSACSIAETKDKLLSKFGLSNSSSSSSEEISSSSEEPIVTNDNIILTINNDYTMTVSEYQFIEEELSYIMGIVQSMLYDLKDIEALKDIEILSALDTLDSELLTPENVQKTITTLKVASYHAKVKGINPNQAGIDKEIDDAMKKIKLIPLALVLNRNLKKTAESYVNELDNHISTMRASGQSAYFNTLMHDIVSVVKLAEQLKTTDDISDFVGIFKDITSSYEVVFDETQLAK